MSTPGRLKLLFIWHQHQPFYKTDGKYLLPWVRMHGIKDYWDMARILDDYPGIRQTFNFTPSLLEQLDDYIDRGAKDAAMVLSEKNPEEFDELDKQGAVRTFFSANHERMIARYPRYAELLAKRGPQKDMKDLAASTDRFTPQDFRDLQVWWNLSWIGEYSRFDPPFKSYLEKEKNFSEGEKLSLLRAQRRILRRIVPQHLKLAKRGQIEISVSPFYHPILPLVCDTNVALQADPGTRLPANRYRRAEDARYQVRSALSFAKKRLGMRPAGMWPSEGSVSDETLKILADERVEWTATDEAILRKSLARSGRPVGPLFLEKYFAYRFTAGGRDVKVFFRDHSLSDLIGFVYSRWSPDDAAHDFIGRLLKIRMSLLEAYGPRVLESAVVPVVLDGENAWEFYQSDGKDFLRTLYYLLEKVQEIETVLPSDVKVEKGNALTHIEPGSWINGNFRIWIGHPEDNKAWDLLHHARETYEKPGRRVTREKKTAAFREIMIAEGSDWCWWYGDENKSSESDKFDQLFRDNLKKVYLLLGKTPPAEIEEPIKRKVERLTFRQPSSMISPKPGELGLEEPWVNAGFASHEAAGGSMQRAGMRLEYLAFGNDSQNVYLKIKTSQTISRERVVVDIFSPFRLSMEVGSRLSLKWENGRAEGQFTVSYEVGDSVAIAYTIGRLKSDEAALSVSLYDGDVLLDSVPQEGVIKFRLLQ